MSLVTVGSHNKNKKINKNKSKVTIYNKDKCVIHMIDCSMDHYNNEEQDVGEYISDYISDQYPDLWKMMKRGDLVEDINESGYKSQGRYIVDIEHSQKEHVKMIRCGLIITSLYTEYNDYGTIPLNFYTITEFSLWYFDDDNLVVNDTFAKSDNNNFTSYWYCHPACTPISLDHKRLKLDQLTNNNIFTKTDKEINWKKKLKMFDYLYVVLRFKKSNYLFISRYYHDDNKKEKNDQTFIKSINRIMLELSYYCDAMKSPVIMDIATEEGVDPKNILWI